MRIETHDSPKLSSGNIPGLRLIAIVVVFVSLCLGLGRLPLIQPDEGRNAEIAREMKDSGAWLVPTFNGVDFLDKPAFFFKAVALSFSALGNTETAARLPSAIFGVGLIALIFLFCRRVYGSARVAWLAVMVVATLPLYFAHARIVIFDMTLAFFVCGAIFAGFLAEEAEGRSRRNWYLLGAAAAGFATLVKGPVGFIIPVLVLLVTQPLAGRRGAWRRLFAPLNFLLFFAITLPWFIGLCLKRPDFLHYGLVEESFNRFTSTKTFNRGKPFYYYAVLVAGTFFPWSLLLPEALVATWKRRVWQRHRADLLCLVWAVLVVGFFSISQSKQPGYVLSVCVACGILFARLVDAALMAPKGQAANMLRRAVMPLPVLCVLGLGAVIWITGHPDKFAKMLRSPDVDPQSLLHHAWPMVISFVILGSLSALGIFRRSPWICFLCLALFCPLALTANVRAIEIAMASRSAQGLVEQLRTLPPDAEIVALECYPNGAAFYLNHNLPLITASGRELRSNYINSLLKRPGPWPATLVHVEELDGWLASRKTPVYLIVDAGGQARLEAIATPRGATVQPLTRRYFGTLLPVPAGN